MEDYANGTRKIESAKTALISALNVFNEHENKYHNLEVGLLSTGMGEVRVNVPLKNFDYKTLSNAVHNLEIGSGTPLGPGLDEARKQLENSGHGLESILMFTDGEANMGENPITVYSAIREADQKAGRGKTKLHFIAFNTDTNTLNAYKQIGAQTYSAEDGNQLKDVLVRASERILLEEEEISTNRVK